MREELSRKEFHEAIDTTLSGLQGHPFLAQRIMSQEKAGQPAVKKRLSVGLVLAMILVLFAVTALAVALLTPKQIVEQVAVPAAQKNDQEHFTYEELAELIRILNENGITLDEGSTLMRAFQAGHGYWEQDAIDAICFAAFGKDQGAWTLEQKHWYGEMMVEIGVTRQNIWLLPEDGEITLQQALRLASDTLQAAYGVELPTESNDEWMVCEILQLGWDEEKQTLTRDLAEWEIWYIHRITGNMDYSVRFDRFGNQPSPSRASYMESIRANDIATVMNDLENREGGQLCWSLETWAEFGELIKNLLPDSRIGWLYQHADYRLPPDNAIPPEQAKQIARKATGMKEPNEETVFCCMDGSRWLYKVCQRASLPAPLENSSHQDGIWCIELDCITGEVLNTRQYTGQPDDAMMLVVPFSLLDKAPDFEERSKTADADQAEERSLDQLEIESVYSNFANLYFLPLTRQKELFGDPHAVPAQDEYEQALAIAQRALEEHYGSDVLNALGEYQIGVIYCIQENVDGVLQKRWDFLFTTDPEFLSDGYRIQFSQNIDDDLEDDIVDLIVEHANIGNG